MSKKGDFTSACEKLRVSSNVYLFNSFYSRSVHTEISNFEFRNQSFQRMRKNEVSTVSDYLSSHVICWCWSNVFSEVQQADSC